MKNKLYISGDSFCMARNYPYPGKQEGKFYSWFSELADSYKDTHEIILDSDGGRDAQTIIDNWIKILPTLTSDDIVVICIPPFFRFRIPWEKEEYETVKWSGGQVTNRFISYLRKYNVNKNIFYLNKQPISKKELDERIRFFETMYLDNESIELNYNEVIESLYNITPSKKYLFSWDDMKNKTNVIEYKKDITEKIGWSTRADLYKETNGKAGFEGDFHWDYKFEKTFFNYLIDKFK